MYQYIINPVSGRKVSVFGNIGNKVIKNYLSQFNTQVGRGPSGRAAARLNSIRRRNAAKRRAAAKKIKQAKHKAAKNKAAKKQSQVVNKTPIYKVGDRVKIFWNAENTWFLATVTKYNSDSNTYSVIYDDGDIGEKEPADKVISAN